MRQILLTFMIIQIVAAYSVTSFLALLKPQTKWIKVVHQGIETKKKDDLSLPA